MKNAASLLSAMLIVSGCSISPVHVGDGVYRADYTSILGAGASADFVREEARGKAIKFCEAQGKMTEVIYAQGQGGTLGIELAKAQIEFKCIESTEQ